MHVIDQATIIRRFDAVRTVASIRAAYVAASEQRAEMPPVGYLAFGDRGDAHVKYAHIHGASAFVVKIATNFPGNNQHGVSANDGLSMVISAETGKPLALLQDHGWLTDARTGMGGALASLALARPDSRRVAVLGSGVQAYQQVVWLSKLWPTQLQFGLWGRSKERAAETATGLANAGVRIDVTDDPQALCSGADIVITTTAARSPIVASDWIRTGTHITAVGADAPGKQELSTHLVASADLLVADLATQCLDHGEFSTAAGMQLISPDQVVEMGAILGGRHPGRTSPDQITIADLTGLAVQDVAIALGVLETCSD